MAKKLSIAQVIAQANSAAKHERVAALRANDSGALRNVLAYALDPRVVWLLPEGEPPYKPAGSIDTEGVFYAEQRRLYLFVQGGNSSLKPAKRELLYVQLLEAIHPDDAKLVVSMKEGKFNTLYKNITRKLIEEAFPGLVPVEARKPDKAA